MFFSLVRYCLEGSSRLAGYRRLGYHYPVLEARQMTSLVVRKASGEMLKLKLVPVVHNKEIRGEVGVLKLEWVSVVCPACGQQVEAVATDGRVKGYCAVAKQSVNFLIETQLAPQSVVRIGNPVTAETRAKISTSLQKHWQDPEYRATYSTAVSVGMKRRWQDPEYRARVSTAHMGKHLTAETKAKISAALRRHNKIGVRGND